MTYEDHVRSVPRRQPVFRFTHLLFILLFGFSLTAVAQQATVLGTVTDPGGAAVPNVKITVTSLESGVSKSIVTNSAGQYVVPDLNIGHYSVKAEGTGFKSAEQKNVALQVGDRDRIDFQLEVGEVQQTVTVEANAVRVQTDSGEQSSVITGQQISQIAVSGRSMYQLAALVPGASSEIGAGGMSAGEVNTPVGGDASVEFNGLRQNHNIYLLDGGEDDDRGGAGGMSIAPSSDAIAEFRTLTSNYSADYGLSSAGTMSMVLKSGTRNLHASAWEFNRNDAFDARNYFNPAPQKVAELRLNVFGFNVGGPVTLGHLYNPERKRTFFFYNMEWRRLIQGGLTNQPVPGSSNLRRRLWFSDDQGSCGHGRVQQGACAELPRRRLAAWHRAGGAVSEQHNSLVHDFAECNSSAGSRHLSGTEHRQCERHAHLHRRKQLSHQPY